MCIMKVPGYLIATTLSLTTLFSQGQTTARKKISLDDNWKFKFGHAANPEKDFNYSIATIFSKSGGAFGTAIDPRFRDSAWRTLDLPHDWAVQLPFVNVDNGDVESHGYKPVGGLFPETSIGWYRKHFTISSGDSGTRFQIQFDGIFRNANIWLNGFFVGNNMSGYIGASYDVTDFIRFDRDNVLVVRVDATMEEGWFYEGAGIYRHVWLNKTSPLHIATDGIFVTSNVKAATADVTAQVTLLNEFKISKAIDVVQTVVKANGEVVTTETTKNILLNSY